MKFIVFGATGFLGRHFSDKVLMRDDIQLSCVSRKASGALPKERQAFFTFDDFCASGFDQEIASADAVVYLGTASIPSTFATEPWREVGENVEPLLRIFHRTSSINPNAKLVFASSGGTVYGPNRFGRPMLETDHLAPISAYGLAKVMAEQAVGFFGRARNMKYAILRIGNPVGVHAESNLQGLVGAVMRNKLANRPIRIFGDGSNVRDFLSADDVADAILLAATDKVHEQETWNVGSGIGLSVNRIISLISEETKSLIEVQYEPARMVDVDSIILDSQKIRRDLGWEARKPLSVEISAMWTRFVEAAQHGLERIEMPHNSRSR